MPMCRASPSFKGLVPQVKRAAQRAQTQHGQQPQSRACSVTLGSSSTWHSNDKAPETSPNKPIAVVGKAVTRLVINE